MPDNDGPKKRLSGLLVVADKSLHLEILRKISRHVGISKPAIASTIRDANIEIMRHEPDAILIDISNLDSRQFQRNLEPFLLSLPGWIKTYLVDFKPTRSRVFKAKNLGVNGIIKPPFSHRATALLVQKLLSRDP